MRRPAVARYENPCNPEFRGRRTKGGLTPLGVCCQAWWAPMLAEAPQSALDRDTRLLSELLEETIAGQGGEGLRHAVVRLREAGARVRAGEPGADAEAAALVAEILAGDSLDVIRACSMELHLANLGETRERVRRMRGYQRAEGPPQRESLAEAADRLAARSSKAAARALDDLRLDLTLTAHPTEATRWSVMEHAGDVSTQLAQLDDERLGAAARTRVIDRIRESLALWWQTADVRRERPQVDDEVRRNLHFFDNVLFDAVPELVRELERCFGRQPLDFAPVRFSSWAGGDMDGHPGVTAATFTATVDLHRRLATRLLRERIERLASRASQSADEMGAGRAALEASLRRDASLMPEVTRRLGERRRREPVRAKLNYVSERLAVTGEQPDDELAYREASQLRRDLELVRDASGGEPIADGAIKDILRQVSAFGLHVARLDVRLAADAIGESVRRDEPHLDHADEAERRHILAARIAATEPDRFGPTCQPTEALHALSAAARRYGPAASDTLVISMVHEVSDVLGALWLARRAGLGGPDEPPLHVTPLFETLGGARAGAGDDGRALRRSGLPRAPGPPRRPPGDHARLLGLGQGRRLPHQPVGDLPRAGAARRPGARARRRGHASSTAAAARRRAAARPPTRRSSPSRRARSRAACGSPSRARSSRPSTPIPSWPAARSSSSCPPCCSAAPRRPAGAGRRSAPRSTAPRRARARPTASWSGSEDFVRFFRQVSPVDELAELTIGSRPASRRAGGRLEDLRAIPWVFAWTQNRILLPSWFGAGRRARGGRPRAASARCGARGRSSGWRARRSRWRCSRSTSTSAAATSRWSTTIWPSATGRCWRPSTRAWSPACSRSATASRCSTARPRCASGCRTATTGSTRSRTSRSRCWRARGPVTRRSAGR